MSYREVFVFVVGTTPQIATETIYALHRKKPSVHPHEIHIITTIKGKEIAERELVASGRLAAFYAEFKIKPIKPDIHLIRDKNGTPLDDIRSEKDNESLGDFIAAFIREKTQDDKARLHCSIAGGRKTMSFYLGSALSFFGRPWDKLYHVLVTPEFEGLPDFYWKPKKNKMFESKGKMLNTKVAEITLAELPFIRLRHKLTLDARGFRELVATGQKDIDEASVQLPLKSNLKERTIFIGEKKINLPPMQLATYNVILMQKVKGCKHLRQKFCGDCTECYYLQEDKDFLSQTFLGELQKTYKMLYSYDSGMVEKFDKTKRDISTFRQDVSKINKIIRKNLQDYPLDSFYCIDSAGEYGSPKYGIRLEKGKIKIE